MADVDDFVEEKSLQVTVPTPSPATVVSRTGFQGALVTAIGLMMVTEG